MSDFGMLAQRLAAAIVRREELNDEWDDLQAEITATIAELRGTLAAEEAGEAPTQVIPFGGAKNTPVPDHVRLRRAGAMGGDLYAWSGRETEIGQAAIVPCPQGYMCLSAPHFHTADGGVHAKPILRGIAETS
jgi:hypothetical protein